MAPDESERDEHRQPGPGATAQGGPRAAEAGEGDGDEREQGEERRRQDDELRERAKETPTSPDEEYPGRQARSGAARSQ
jgi:hypothetical protein